jgi:3',5'-cyclic AMP phosphodiesterase CpdA
MLKIAHISDLHFIHSDIEQDTTQKISAFSRLAYEIGKRVGPDIIADGHNNDKLAALKNCFLSLKPDVIVVTGDLTNYGDSKSFQLAVESIKELKEIAGAKYVFCIPGNHDSLVERVAVLRKQGKFVNGLITLVSTFIPAVSTPDKLSVNKKYKTLLEQGKRQGKELPLLKTYQQFCEPEFGEVDPGKPLFVDAGWGEVAFFLFNSTNDPAFMANEGSIGAQQYNRLNSSLDDPNQQQRIDAAVRIALLHHHPLNSPDNDETRSERFYDAMTDGTRFIEYTGKRNFHFIFHGHQHRKYLWEFLPGIRPHVCAAGSALAGASPESGSFNVIELNTPFEAIYRRFDYSATGLTEITWAKKSLKVHSLENIRISDPGEPKTGEDLALQNLIAGRSEGFDDLHEYKLLEYDVTITEEQLYIGKYRRKGKVTGETRSYGLTFIVNGNPPMEVKDMDVVAKDGNGNVLSLDCNPNTGTQKVFRVLHSYPLDPGKEFDITFEFKWQASEAYPNHFDAINLMYFLKSVETLSYQVRLPWKPAQFDVFAYGIRKSTPLRSRPEYKQRADGTHEYSFKLFSPKPLSYLISLKPTV